jgi:hypothetical protein
MQPASATRNDAIPPVASEALAEGLMLVRASTLKIIRLQLAMERRDRRVALEAVDDLVALDRSLEQFLTSVPAVGDDGLFSNVLELERSALNVEKHTLAAGISNRGWEVETPEPEPAEAGADWTYDEPEPEHSSRWRTIAILTAILAVACAAYWLGASGLVPGFIREVL